MNANEYQELAARTLIDEPDRDIPDNEIMIVWNAIGLAGEAGEVAEQAKKGVFHQHGINRDAFAKELGDCLWYIAALCTKLDLSMSEIMSQNIDKLKRRYPAGYSPDYSERRLDLSD
jgi:NTP pyrophosphatase (non-canonical NTP hydrolase)